MMRLIHIPTAVDDAVLTDCLGDLPLSERHIHPRYHAARKQRIVAHAVLRRLLGKQLGIAPRHVPLQRQALGKPVLSLAAHAKTQSLYFNLSYSGDHALLALADQPIGVDIESVVPSNMAQVARHMYTPQECQRLQGADAAHRFLDIWSAKEAVLKFLGIGLRVEPRQLHVPPACADFQPVCVKTIAPHTPSCMVASWRLLPATPIAVSMAHPPASISWEHYVH